MPPFLVLFFVPFLGCTHGMFRGNPWAKKFPGFLLKLRTLITSIASTLTSLMWAMILLALVIYVGGPGGTTGGCAILLAPKKKHVGRSWKFQNSRLQICFAGVRNVKLNIIAGWWFQIFFIFTPIWGRFPFKLIFFKWVEIETTN